MLARRRSLPVTEVKSASTLVQQAFIMTGEFAEARVVALYAPIHNEVDTAEVMQVALASTKIVLFPAVCHKGLEFRRITSPSVLRRGAFNILEPDETCPVHSPEEADLIVVPGVTFDVCGRRIGYGKGYYDKSLHQLEGKGKMVGFCYDFQLVGEIAEEPHDVKMDMIITERRTINLRY
jgi:5-formyltetrahydrofolate cyclo-ligase